MMVMNFRTLISDLIGSGLTQAQIAAAVGGGCRQSTISDLHRGVIKEPTYSRGLKLVGLHRRVMRRIKKVA